MQTNRQTDTRQADKQTCRHVGKQTCRQAGKETSRQADTQTSRQLPPTSRIKEGLSTRDTQSHTHTHTRIPLAGYPVPTRRGPLAGIGRPDAAWRALGFADSAEQLEAVHPGDTYLCAKYLTQSLCKVFGARYLRNVLYVTYFTQSTTIR